MHEDDGDKGDGKVELTHSLLILSATENLKEKYKIQTIYKGWDLLELLLRSKIRRPGLDVVMIPFYLRVLMRIF